jgi:MPBQ/MSBQ methyltransferase
MRFLQHKEEAYWFYRYLSIVYDDYVNPWFYDIKMRDAALTVAKLDKPELTVAEVGAGTGFTTEGICKTISPKQVHALDQSDFQQAKAKKKATLNGVTFYLGDAEALPWETDRFDRYVSAGSIEYWPDPQRAIAEAYRIIKPGGSATIIGPLKPENSIAAFIAETFMLFPTLDEYRTWYKAAGFVDIEYLFVRPPWMQREKYGISIVGKKPEPGVSSWVAPTVAPEESLKAKSSSRSNPLLFLARLLIGAIAGGIFIPIALAKTALLKIRGAH